MNCKPIKAFLGLFVCLICNSTINHIHAQGFNYSFSQTTATYNSISSPTTIVENKMWSNETFQIPIGFDFSFHGNSFDSVYIKPDGLLSFDQNNAHAFYALKGAIGRMDTLRNFSSVSYSLTGSSGSRILKIQYSDVSLEAIMSALTLNMQVWLYEANDAIDIRYGTNSYYALSDSLYSPVVGLVSFSNGTPINSYLLKGNPSSPVAEIPIGEGELRFMIRVPSPGQVYTFTPN